MYNEHETKNKAILEINSTAIIGTHDVESKLIYSCGLQRN